MIRIVVLFFLLMMSILVQGQSSTVLRKGKVVDAKQEELAFVTVLLKDEEGRVVTSFYTDDKGEYQVDSKENFSVIEFQYVGFQSQAFPLTEGLPAIVHLVEDNALLEEVVITAKRPTIKREIDRLVFNVQDTPLATTNAWDIVKQTPGVNAIGDNLSIRGSQSILVTINDKKVMLSGDQLKSLLEGTDGTQVEAIEVITNPPAKYEAQGNAVLNIKLKKNNSPKH